MGNWAEQYSNKALDKLGVPAHRESNDEEGHYRGAYLKWSDLEKSVSDQRDLSFWLICCDVLEIDKPMYLNQDMFVFARRIEVAPRGRISLDITEDKRLVFSLTAQEIIAHDTGKKTSIAMSVGYEDENEDPQSDKYDLALVAAKSPEGAPQFLSQGLYLEAAKKKLSRYPAAVTADGFLGTTDYLPRHLRMTFHLACLNFTHDPETAMKYLDWVAALTKFDKRWKALSSDAHGLNETISAIEAAGDDVLLVPQLDYSVYAEDASACMDVLRDRQSRYDKISSDREDLDKWILNIKTAIQDKSNDVSLATKLKQKAADTARQAANARQLVANSLMAEEKAVRDARVDLSRGIKDWMEDGIMDSAKDIAMSVFDIATQLPAIVASGGALGALPLAQMAGDGLKAAGDLTMSVTSRVSKSKKSGSSGGGDDVQVIDFLFDEDADDRFEDFDLAQDFELVTETPEAKEFADQLEMKYKLIEAKKKVHKENMDKLKAGGKALFATGKDVAAIGQSIMKIVDIIAAAEAMEKQSEETLLKATATLDGAFGPIKPIGIDVVTGGAQEWDLLANSLKAYWENLPKIGGKDAFKEAIGRMIIKGKVMSETRLALAKANSDLTNATLRLKAADEARKIYDRNLHEFEAKEAMVDAMEQLAFDRILDGKRSVYLAMEVHKRAHSYFVLDRHNPAGELPNITDNLEKFGEVVKRISSRRLTDEALRPQPQPLNREFKLSTKDANVSIAPDGAFEWHQDHSNTQFSGFFRIRLERLRVYVVTGHSSQEFTVEIENSGHYEDRNRGAHAAFFVSDPYFLRFRYNTSKPDTPIADGTTVRRFKDDFFLPTPFSHWTFRVFDINSELIHAKDIASLSVQLTGQMSTLPRQ